MRFKKKMASALLAAMLAMMPMATFADTPDIIVDASVVATAEEASEVSSEELSEVMMISDDVASNENTYESEKQDGVTAFVTRLYDVCLGRKPDAAGLNDWVGKLTRKEITGAQAAYGFIFSQEFQNKNYCNTDYTKQLYRAFMGREFDQAGLNDWVGQLNSGKTREEVFNGFSQSNEFRKLCGDYGIDLGAPIAIPQYGTVPHGSCSVCGEQDGVTAFVTRLYKVCLDREPDKAGLDDWTSKLWNHTMSGKDVARGFALSPEFSKKCGSTYDLPLDPRLTYYYRAFFGREPDYDGLMGWLYASIPEEQVIEGFAGSEEFKNMCRSYGIEPGVANYKGNGVNGFWAVVDSTYREGVDGHIIGGYMWVDCVTPGICPLCGKNFIENPDRSTYVAEDGVTQKTISILKCSMLHGHKWTDVYGPDWCVPSNTDAC